MRFFLLLSILSICPPAVAETRPPVQVVLTSLLLNEDAHAPGRVLIGNLELRSGTSEVIDPWSGELSWIDESTDEVLCTVEVSTGGVLGPGAVRSVQIELSDTTDCVAGTLLGSLERQSRIVQLKLADVGLRLVDDDADLTWTVPRKPQAWLSGCLSHDGRP